MRGIEIHGYAIVSDDDMIADSKGEAPPSLRNPEDWRLYQAALAASDLVVFARRSHENEPETHGVTRVVLSSSANGLEQRDGVWWWRPEATPWSEVVARLLPNGGEVAAPGGQGVFDLFLDIGYDVFHLVRAHGVELPGGRKVFSSLRDGVHAEDALAARGLALAERVELDPKQNVELKLFRKPRS